MMKLTYRALALIVCTLLAMVAGGLVPAMAVRAATPGPVVGWGRGTEGQLGSAGGSAVAPRTAEGAASDGVAFIAAGSRRGGDRPQAGVKPATVHKGAAIIQLRPFVFPCASACAFLSRQ